jgi:HSP20 family molecular chaperone IbpA
VGENAAAEVGAEVVLDPLRDAVAFGVGRGGLGEEGLEVVPDERVEGCGRGIAAAVDGGQAVGPRGSRRLREGAAGCGPAGAGRRGRGHVFDLMNQPSFAPAAGAEMVGIMPAVEITESNGDFVCTVELPGLSEKDVQVGYTADGLTIKGEKKDERETSDKRYHMLERSYGSFERTFTFPAKVDAEKIVWNSGTGY